MTGTFTNVPYVGESKRVLVAAKTDAGIVVGFIDPKGKGVTVSRQQGTNDEPLSELVLSDAQIAADEPLARVSGDGAYDTEACPAAIAQRGRRR